MTQEELRKISLVQLQIMDEVHKICESSRITYYIIGGTLLGAVRHKGFIPWDLDIDIAMPREDYERFRQVCETDLPERYAYLDYRSAPNFMRPPALVADKTTRIHIKYDHLNPKIMDLGIYIDIFPLDNAPDEEALRNKQAQELLRLRKRKNVRIPYSYSCNAWRRRAHYLLSALHFWTNPEKLNRRQQELMQRYRHRKTECICSMGSQYSYQKQCMPRQIYGTPTLLEFEGRYYFAPEKYTDYLTRLYGDYMQLPPEEKRRANLEIFTSVEFL